jgi:hypothetical protein
MGGYNNPVLNGIFRGLQLASLVQNQRIRQQNAASLEGARQEAARRNTAIEQRQAELDAERAQEKVRDFRLKARESGAVPLDPSQAQAFRSGEDFSVELAPGLATTASASAIEGPGGGLFAFPGPVEKGALDLEQRLEQFARQREIDEQHRTPPRPRYQLMDDPETGDRVRVNIDTLESQPTGIKVKPTIETPAGRRARETAETQERVEATANVLLDDAGGDPERALNLLEQEITRPSNPERSEFLSRQRIAIRQLLKGARTEGAPPRPKELTPANKFFMEKLAVDAEQLDIMRAIGGHDLPSKLLRAVEMVRNEPEPEPNLLARVGITDAPQPTTIEQLIGSGRVEGVTAEDIALLKEAGIDVATLGQRRSRSPLQGKTEASRRGKGATLKAAPSRTPAKGGGGAAQEWQRYKSKGK